MKLYILSIIFTCCIISPSLIQAQGVVGANGASPDASSMLDVQSTEKGMLLPSMTNTERIAIPSPAGGNLIFQTDSKQGFHYNEGTPASPEWVRMANASELAGYEKRTPITFIPFTITEPGSYYLPDSLIMSTNNGDGITIDTDNVTIDLNGYAIKPAEGVNSDDGIFVLGSQNNICIRNGAVFGWGGDGINALNADYSYFVDLHISNNGGDGLVTDFNCIINNCSAYNNGLDGLEGDDGTIIYNSTASENEDNGIQTSEGCIVTQCVSNNNETDGIDVAAGSKVEHCTIEDNIIFGVDLALGGNLMSCYAKDNDYNGMDIASSALVMGNYLYSNGDGRLDSSSPNYNNTSNGVGCGMRTFANAQIVGNYFIDNVSVGLVISSTDAGVYNNVFQGNGVQGLLMTSSGGLAMGNKAEGNGWRTSVLPTIDPLTSPYYQLVNHGNYYIDPNTSKGPIINTNGMGDMSTNAGTSNIHANYER